MGCGQSKLGIYQRKSKSKKNGSKRSEESGENDEETEEPEETTAGERKDSGEKERGDEDGDSVAGKIKQMAQQQQQQQTGGAVLAQSDISSSQLDFFKMLDEKIENGPDYEESDEEEHKARLSNVLKEWRSACVARQQKKSCEQQESWPSPGRGGKSHPEEYENYPGRRAAVDTQRFPTGYSACPPPGTALGIHLQNSFRVTAPAYAEQPRMQPRMPAMANYHPYQPPPESYNHCEEPSGHPLSTSEPPNPLRVGYPQVLLRQSSINSQLHHYPENQRLYQENVRQFPADLARGYPPVDQRQYPAVPRAMPTVNVLHEHRMYAQELNARPYHMYQEDPSRQEEEVQRMMQENARPPFENQRMYHERLKEKQRQYAETARQLEGPRTQTPFQRPPLLSQRSMQEPPRTYRDLENEEHCFPRQERFPEPGQEGSNVRLHNPTHLKMNRSLSMDVQYVAGPPPPREMIPLQGVPGPPQGSPRPLVARGLQPNMHRLPASSVAHYRKPQGAFT